MDDDDYDDEDDDDEYADDDHDGLSLYTFSSPRDSAYSSSAFSSLLS